MLSYKLVFSSSEQEIDKSKAHHEVGFYSQCCNCTRKNPYVALPMRFGKQTKKVQTSLTVAPMDGHEVIQLCVTVMSACMCAYQNIYIKSKLQSQRPPKCLIDFINLNIKVSHLTFTMDPILEH
jgi:hypothetical protein